MCATQEVGATAGYVVSLRWIGPGGYRDGMQGSAMADALRTGDGQGPRASAPVVELCLMGPLALRIDGVEQSLGGPRQRAVLGLLALESNRTVSVDRIILELWGDDHLRQPRNNVQVYVSNLRRCLRDVQHELWIAGDGGGYRLDATECVIDHEGFSRTVDDARTQLGRGLAEAAARSVSAALDQWRGPFLEDLAVQFDVFSNAADRAHEHKMFATELRIAAELEAGRSSELVAELQELTAVHPLREHFWMQLMTALHRAGRQTEALRAYQRARSALADEAGLDPGSELRALEAALLSGDLPSVGPPLEGTQLVFTDPMGVVRRVPLVDGTYTVGRNPDVDVPIEWDAKASRMHATLRHGVDGWHLEDCGSTNGTFINGRRTAGQTLVRPGDVFIAGSTAFALREHSHEPTVAWSPTEATVIETITRPK